jgi:hypothetical protein
MMTISVRDTCRALGFGQTVSLCTDVLGFTRGHCPGRLGPTRPDTAFSIRSFVHGLRRAHFHVRLLIAGTDVITSNDWRVLEYAVYRLRDIYTTNGIGVGRITFAGFTAAMSLGHDVVTSDTELPTTGHDLTENGDFIPVVLPASMNVTTVNPDGSVTVTLGLSPVPGPCSPRRSAGMNSSVVDIAGEETGRTLAHEVGHNLGCDHPATPGATLMTQTGSAVGDPFNAISIIGEDLTTMRAHCTMNNAIPGI